jgi:hypothetical protein
LIAASAKKSSAAWEIDFLPNSMFSYPRVKACSNVVLYPDGISGCGTFLPRM